jgi:hypothetical protein
VTSPALALDEFLSRLTPTDREAMRNAAPVALLDQVEAAEAEVDQLVRIVGRFADSSFAELDYADVSEWVRLSVADTLLRFHRGTHDTCTHNPSPARPQPVLASAWRPGLVTCGRCTHLFKATGDADRTCDRCGRVCAGLPGDGIHSCTLTFGALGYFYGLCVDCMVDQTEATT